jgi:hypothetical protein
VIRDGTKTSRRIFLHDTLVQIISTRNGTLRQVNPWCLVPGRNANARTQTGPNHPEETAPFLRPFLAAAPAVEEET